MKVAVVGGAGAMGRKAVETIVGFDEVEDVLVLDRDPVRLAAVAERAGSKVATRAIDVRRAPLAEHLADADVVFNALGPFTAFGTVVFEAAVAARCHYVDINDDWEPTLDVLALAPKAREAGITALVGMGLSPGVSNVLAARAAAELDEVTELYTGWMVAGTDTDPHGGSRPSAAVLHLVAECTGTVQAVVEGATALVRPLERLDLHYPGIGAVEVRTIGHPEPVTLPLSFPGLDRCANLMVGPAWWFSRLEQVMADVDAGRLDTRDAALLIEDGFARPPGAGRYRHTPRVWGLAVGVRDGQRATAAVGLSRWPDDGMAGATAIPGSVAVRMLLRGQIDRPGVVTPEEVVPFALLMEALEPYYLLPDRDQPLFEIAVDDVTSTSGPAIQSPEGHPIGRGLLLPRSVSADET